MAGFALHRWKVGLSRPAAWQHWAAALCVIAMKLNGETYEVAASQLAINADFEQRKVTNSTLSLKLGADGPNVLRS
jgi:hypothetical protein